MLNHFTVTQLFSHSLNNLKTVPGADQQVDGVPEGEAKNQAEDDRKPANESPFNYAISYWLKHAMDVPHGKEGTRLSKSLWELVRDFFWENSGAAFAEWLRVYPRDSSEDWHGKPITSSWFCCRCLNSVWNRKNNSCLEVAASYGLVDIFDWAHPEGVEFDLEFIGGWTPLLHAALLDEEGKAKAILSERNVNINRVRCNNSIVPLVDCNLCRDGGTPLDCATVVHRIEAMKLLLNHSDIDVDIIFHGTTALGRVIHSRFSKGFDLLIGAGAKLAMYNGEVLEIPSSIEDVGIKPPF